MPSIVDGNGLNGLVDISKALADLPRNVENRLVKNAMYRGATVLRDKARAAVPVETGALRSAIIAKAKVLRKGVVFATAGVSRKEFKRGKRAGREPRRYAHLVEFGTEHSAAKPFMRPAMDDKERLFNEIFLEAKKSFETQLAKLKG